MSTILDTISDFFERDLCNSDDCLNAPKPGDGGQAPLFEIAIVTIFAREILEACIIMGQYRTVIFRSPDFQEETRQKKALRAVTMAAVWASLAAVVLAAGLTIGLYVAGKEMSHTTAEVIEGVSKLIASVCVLQLSAKVPKWLGLYFNPKANKDGVIEGLDERSIRFNVAWNLWREVAECGVFLIPYMIGDSARSIPVSAAVGIVIGLAGGYGTYWAQQNLDDTRMLAFFLANLTGWLSLGLFNFPMVMIKVFGYTNKRTVLEFCTFWAWFLLAIGYHYRKYSQSEKARLAAQHKNNKAETFHDDVEEA
ncbi:hypothetical protein CTEN210_16423 [Chaetoceros tenuissimus]|uniref:Uncharacterized protein n=1 Tax=Chaetoceros tenuissimus TaxID=426638 RepID=A0AAD3D9K0_9STRA|nr:hypothetical protein CTEN210_16423 [Chaetoceros tenuissimus]